MTVIELVWKDTIVWKGLNAKSNMFVVCRTHTPRYELFGTESLWKCLLPSAKLHACNNLWSRCSYDNSFLSWSNSSPIRWQFMVCELITCYSQSRDPFRLCNTDNWMDWSSACTCHMKYSRQRWKWPPKSAHPMMWLYNCHLGCFFVFRRKWFIDCSCILQCFFYVSVNRHDCMKWVGCRKQPVCGVLHSHHVVLCEPFGTDSLKVLATISWIGYLFKYANRVHSPFTLSATPTHTLHTFSFNHTHCTLLVSTTHTHFTVLYMQHKPIYS